MHFYKLSKNAVIETFEDGALVLNLHGRRLVELSPSDAAILNLLDGQRSSEQVADEISQKHDNSHDYPITQIIHDVLKLCDGLNQIGILELPPNPEEDLNMTTAVATLFIRNPDVVLREEDPDEGALLFNPDTNQVKVINTTGLFIWQRCNEARTLDELMQEIQKDFEDAPAEQVVQDVQEYLDDMLANGFIGTVEKSE